MAAHRSRSRSLALLAVALLLVACGRDGAGPGPSSTTAPAVQASPGLPPPAPPPPAGLQAVRFRDRNGSGAPDGGDELVLAFDRPVVLGNFDPARDLAVLPAGSLGVAAVARAGARAEEVVVTLGGSARLALFDTYRPGEPPGPDRSPAHLRLAPGPAPSSLRDGDGRALRDSEPAPILAEPDSRPRHQGAPYADPEPARARACFGNLHAHTGYSDGQATPAVAYAWARDVAGLDFMCVTDHAEQLTPDEWRATLLAAAAEQVPGRFVALTGYEWNWGVISLVPLLSSNHINVIGTRSLPDYGRSYTLWSFWDEAQATGLPEGAVGQFNHPSAGVTQPAWARQQGIVIENWNHLSLEPRADRLMGLMRVEGRGSAERADIGYLPALRQGWHVSPQSSQDNHAADWGTASERRTGVWLERLEQDELLRALREGRTFSSDDRDATLRLLAEGRLWMGSTVQRPGPVALQAEVADPSGEAFLRLELIGPGGAVVAAHDLAGRSSGTLALQVDPPEDAFFFAHAVQADGDELFSAPIYVDR